MNAWVKTLIVLLVVGAIGYGSWQWYARGKAASSSSFKTTEVKRGDLVATISATGTVEPEEVIDVGAQVAGQILVFGKDPSGKTVDYGSEVEEGTILAQIDDSLYKSDVDEATATLEQSKANLARAQADLGQFKAKLDQATHDWDRAKAIGPASDALSKTD